ncbi:MAG TPA: 3-oxoacyl-[acyl-carrier-protein] synthase III C-terminal domain-containing protein [Polyangiales bacterium]|nr:3-oxoacyl-[acyl-carrier-protein] synthase III C-terminal domain-containing protein [Polyangiales bacterium]
MQSSPAIVGTATALPRHRYDQRELATVAQRLLPELDVEPAVLQRFFRHAGVEHRYLALPAERYSELRGLGARNDAWLEAALPLAEQVTRAALADAGLTPEDVSIFFSTTITGLAVPSIEARLMNRLPFKPSLKRVPLFGLGCLAGCAGVARAADYLRAYPDQVAVLLSVELCSLTVQRDDASVANLISAGLFGDGAAAVVLVGAKHPAARGPRVLDSQSHFFANTERTMGWDVTDYGFKIVLGKEVPSIAREGLPLLIDAILERHSLQRGDIASWVAHPGGPAVISAMTEALGLPPEALAPTRQSLAQIGNLSSASVLFLLDTFRRWVRPSAGSYGMMIAMGPAFCAEAALLQW